MACVDTKPMNPLLCGGEMEWISNTTMTLNPWDMSCKGVVNFIMALLFSLMDPVLVIAIFLTLKKYRDGKPVLI